MALDMTVESLVCQYLQLHKTFPFSNTTLGNIHQLSLDQIAMLHYQHEQEALHQLRMEIRQWLLRNYGENADFETAASDLHLLKFDINFLVKAEFMGQAIELANPTALKQRLPQPYSDTDAAKLACMQHAIETANAEALRQGLLQPYPDIEAILQHNSLILEAEPTVQDESPAPASAISRPNVESGDKHYLRVVSSTHRGAQWTVEK
ncbi:hypothetical protein GYMLUDRAFT_252050 [Collybiopsis luxurians FD-317 M1]|uniref:Unplaced genomic scaffold GYMLUscaffold_115, whole genome shotgun sequence n=1 Tax=Collybiopsis luxurians FD-317 M1 TaxID=944289 RepID=A0A0D0BPC3_9AGAR|nr:hypothetical protein GYMLUDRAFT_252050 [Collybiopsis luxurians FD-317 M1]